MIAQQLYCSAWG